MSIGASIGLLVALVFIAASVYVIRRSYARGRSSRIVTNEQRPGQPEPGESNPANAKRPRI